MGFFNNLVAAAVVALTMPLVATATPLGGEALQIGALPGQSAVSLLFDGPGGGASGGASVGASGGPSGGAFTNFSGASSTTLRPVTDPLSLTLTTSSSGTTALTPVPLPGSLALLLGGIGAFGVFVARRRSS